MSVDELIFICELWSVVFVMSICWDEFKSVLVIVWVSVYTELSADCVELFDVWFDWFIFDWLWAVWSPTFFELSVLKSPATICS